MLNDRCTFWSSSGGLFCELGSDWRESFLRASPMNGYKGSRGENGKYDAVV